jgi:P4 family phage/plasmid primase-like protien
MTQYFSKDGRQLLANGYLIVPIRPGEKRPAINGWQKARMSVADLAQYASHGVGVLCGQGSNPIVGVDVDISHPVIGPAVIAWCRKNLGMGCERIGAAPRVLLVYRATSAGWAKGNSISFYDPRDPLKPSGKRNDQQVEILGLGQQFVAYADHPDTKRPYDWVDFFGGLTSVLASDLPLIEEAQVEALMAEVARLVRTTEGVEIVNEGLSAVAFAGDDGDDWFNTLTPKVGSSLDDYKRYLACLDNSDGGFDYDTWLHAGMAGHHEFDGSTEARDAWVAWSELSAKHDERTCHFKWQSFGKGGQHPTTMRWLIKVANQAKADVEVEQRREALEKIKAILADATDSTDLTTRIAAKIKPLMPDEAAAKAEIVGIFGQKFKSLAGVSLPVSESRALLLDRRPPTVKTKRPLTEFGNAERMLDKFGQGLMYVPEIGSWYCWTGVYWRKASDIEIEHMAKETIKSLVGEYGEHEGVDASEFFDFCKVSQQAKMVRAMVMLAASDPRVMVPASELDKNVRYMGVQNGVIDLATGQLLDPDPELRITLTMGCDYVPGAKCPLFEQTLSEVFKDDADMVDFFWRVVGYSVLGQPKEDVMLIPFGNGSNGKSTVLNVIRKVFGSYARAAEASSFVADSKAGGGAGGAREDLLRLRGSRFVYVNEPEENSELREGAVKAMTGGDSITARGLYSKESVEITPTWVVFMPTNHKPIVKGSDNGIWRRLVLIPFERNFEGDKTVRKDPDRQERLSGEREGILAWMIRGAAEYQKRGLTQPASIRAARESYRTQMDLLAEWIEECCDIGAEFETPANSLWLSWESYAKTNGILQYVRSNVALGRRLDGRFQNVRNSSGVRVRRGIRLKTASDDFFDGFDG